MAALTPYLSAVGNRNLKQPRSRAIPFEHVTIVLDFASLAALKGSALAQNDTIDTWKIPQGFLVYDAFAVVKTASTAAATIQVGDASTATGFITSVACNGTAGTATPGTGSYVYSTTAATSPKSYWAASGLLRATINSVAAPADGVVELHIIGFNSTLNTNE